MHDHPRRLRDRLDRAFGFLAFVRRRLRAGRRFCAACAFAVCNLACSRGAAAALCRIFLAVDPPHMRRASIEIRPADPKLGLLATVPLPHPFPPPEYPPTLP